MCFAAAADAAVGVIVIGIGVDAVRHVGTKRQVVLASLPLLFGCHQLTEAFVWWGLQGGVGHSVERAAVWVYLLFAFVALPVLVPLAVGLVEASVWRRWLIGASGVLGAVVAAALAIAVLRGPINAEIDGPHIAYHIEALSHGGQWTVLYIIATCGALLLCGHRDIALLGALNLAAVPVLLWITAVGLVSIWCFWAAVMSVLIALHLRHAGAGRFALAA